MPTRKIMTLHAPMAAELAETFLKPAIDLMEQFGYTWWISTEELPHLTLMIESPKEWCERGATMRELEEFFRLWEAGEKDAARFLAQTGLPAFLR